MADTTAPDGSYSASVGAWRVVARKSKLGVSVDYKSPQGVVGGTGLVQLNAQGAVTVNAPGKDIVVRFSPYTGLYKYKGASVEMDHETTPMDHRQHKRRIYLEFDLEDAQPTRDWLNSGNFAKMITRVVEGFNNAGIEAIVPLDPMNWVQSPQNGWSMEGLKNSIVNFKLRNDTVSVPFVAKFHVLICGTKATFIPSNSILFGIMHDYLDGFQREACAVFLPAFYPKNYLSVLDDISATVVHEIGHALNLYHSFDKIPPRNASISFMNYPDKWATFTQKTQAEYWAELKSHWNFDEKELEFLWHAKPKEINPGQAFGSNPKCDREAVEEKKEKEEDQE